MGATKDPSEQHRRILLTVAGLLAVVLILFAGIMVRAVTASSSASLDIKTALEQHQAAYFQKPRPVPEVSLTQHTGEAFTSTQFSGQWHVINFGYTHCPDECSTLADMAKAYQSLHREGLGDEVQMWMLSVDPARDTVTRLADYVPFYHPDFIGLTGEAGELRPLAEQLDTFFVREGNDEIYRVDYSDNIAIINPQGDYVALLRPPHRPQQISEVLSLLVRHDG